jgi:hypothetical protein
MKVLLVVLIIAFGAIIVIKEYKVTVKRIKERKKENKELKIPCGYVKIAYDSGVDCRGNKIYVKPLSIKLP